MKQLKQMPINQAVILDNTTCPYCSIILTNDISSKEHVIGRRFVPKGKLDRQWNLILNACNNCNKTKANLEDDISAITLQPDACGGHPHNDAIAESEAQRKGKNSISRLTRKPVVDSNEIITINSPFFGANLSLKLSAPPQIERQRIYELARFHLMGFFYFITYDKSDKRGGFWQGSCCPLAESCHSDWGNSLHRAFMEAVVEWEPRVLANTAKGFFKLIIRRHPKAECWSWAVEWNCNLRVIGFFGDFEAAQAVASAFPSLAMQTIAKDASESIQYRIDVPLEEKDDILFQVKS